MLRQFERWCTRAARVLRCYQQLDAEALAAMVPAHGALPRCYQRLHAELASVLLVFGACCLVPAGIVWFMQSIVYAQRGNRASIPVLADCLWTGGQTHSAQCAWERTLLQGLRLCHMMWA